MKQIPQSYPFYLYDVPNHSEVKPLILEGIKSMGTHSIVKEGQQFINTDWHLAPNYRRPYFDHLKSVADAHMQTLMQDANFFQMEFPLAITRCWFQQYAQNDHHTWHVHEGSIFANVYYVDLPEGAAKTTFKVSGKEFEVEVMEGQILTFPTCFIHCSKPNLVGVKTVVSFNYL